MAQFVGVIKKKHLKHLLSQKHESLCDEPNHLSLEEVKPSEFVALFRLSNEAFQCYSLDEIYQFFTYNPNPLAPDPKPNDFLPRTRSQVSRADIDRIVKIWTSLHPRRRSAPPAITHKSSAAAVGEERYDQRNPANVTRRRR